MWPSVPNGVNYFDAVVEQKIIEVHLATKQRESVWLEPTSIRLKVKEIYSLHPNVMVGIFFLIL